MRRTLSFLLLSLAVLWCLLSPAPGRGEPLEIALDLTSPSSSFLVARQYPRDNLALVLDVRFTKPGVLLDTVGINAAPVGSFAVHLDTNNRVMVSLYDPRTNTPGRDASGWHHLLSAEPLTAGTTHRLVIQAGRQGLSLQVDGGPVQRLPVTTPLSGEPIHAGDFPGDDHWGSKYNIHPALIGSATVKYVGPRENAPTQALAAKDRVEASANKVADDSANLNAPPVISPRNPPLGVTVAIRGPLPSNASRMEQAMYGLLGQMEGIHAILVVTSAEGFFETLAKYTRDGRKIGFLIIEGHGNAKFPQIVLQGSRIVAPQDVDVAGAQAAIAKEQGLILESRRWLGRIAVAPTEVKTDPDERNPAELQQRVELCLEQIAEKVEALKRLEACRDVMSENGHILMVNCSAVAEPAGVEFVTNLGRVFLSKQGGWITASRTDIGVDMTAGEGGTGFEGLAKWLKALVWNQTWVKPGDYYAAGDWQVFTFDKDPRALNRYLPVSFQPLLCEGRPGATVTLTPTIQPTPTAVN